ncbi:O-antigen ligase family protein [Chloroflexota bacterium]
MNLSIRNPVRLNQQRYLGWAILAVITASIIVIGLPWSVAGYVVGAVSLLLLTFIEPIGGIIILLLVAPLKALIETETQLNLPLDIGQLTLLTITGLWALNRIVLRKSLALRLSIVQIPVALFLGGVLLSLPTSIALGKGLTEALKWFEILFLITFCLALFRHKPDVHWLVFALVLAGSVQAIVGLYEFFGGSGAAHLWILNNQYFRAFGSFGQPNPFGALMGLTLPFALLSTLGYSWALWQEFAQKRPNWRKMLASPYHQQIMIIIFYGAMSGLITAALLASWSRGAWMGIAGATLFMIIFIPRSIYKGIALFGIILIAIILVWTAGFIPSTITSRLGGFVEELTTITDVRGVDITDSNYAVTERIAHWQAAVAMAEESPWFGVGFGNYEVAYPSYALLNWPQPLGHAHNYYLNLMAEVGLVGLAAYLVAWIGILGLTILAWRNNYGIERLWCIALLGVWAYLAIHNMVDKLYVNNLFLHIGCMLGLLAILFRRSHSNRFEATN